MGMDTLKVLLIEDNPGDTRLIREMLTPAPGGRFVLEESDNLSEGLGRLANGSFAAVLLDLSLGEIQGIATLRAVHDRAPGVPVVVLTGLNDEALAAEALQAGAQDYLVKGQVDRHLLARSLRYAVERGRIEEQLRQRAIELAESGRRKDEFLAILSHELRNPLSPLIMAAELLRRQQLGDTERKWAEGMIERQVRTITRLVDDLLDISRISRGKVTLRKESMDLSLAIGRAVETTRPLFEEHRQQLDISLPNDPIRINGDPVRIEQVMVNLLTNAAKYTQAGGRIWVSVKAEGEEAAISVRDSGIGIPADMLGRIFELFTQVDSSTNRPSQWGLGVGLALVRGFVELHGGTIEAKSAGPGGGSEFLVRLPLLAPVADKQQLANETLAEAAAELNGHCKVLIAEDHADSAECLARMCKSWRHDVRVVHNGLDALAAASEFLPDVLLLDIGLPGMDGYEVARSLRKQESFDDSLILALTGYGREEDRQRAADAGFSSHLTKPVDPETLRKLLSTHNCKEPSPQSSPGAADDGPE
jgi:signal transduction histidine kinase